MDVGTMKRRESSGCRLLLRALRINEYDAYYRACLPSAPSSLDLHNTHFVFIRISKTQQSQHVTTIGYQPVHTLQQLPWTHLEPYMSYQIGLRSPESRNIYTTCRPEGASILADLSGNVRETLRSLRPTVRSG